jgi:hypothetical protein
MLEAEIIHLDMEKIMAVMLSVVLQVILVQHVSFSSFFYKSIFVQ